MNIIDLSKKLTDSDIRRMRTILEEVDERNYNINKARIINDITAIDNEFKTDITEFVGYYNDISSLRICDVIKHWASDIAGDAREASNEIKFLKEGIKLALGDIKDAENRIDRFKSELADLKSKSKELNKQRLVAEEVTKNYKKVLKSRTT